MLSADNQVLLPLTIACNVFVTFAAAPEMLHSRVACVMTNYQGFCMRALAFNSSLPCFMSNLTLAHFFVLHVLVDTL